MAFPKFESVCKSSVLSDTFLAGSGVLPKPNKFAANPENVLVSLLLLLLLPPLLDLFPDNSFNSFSKLSNSPKSKFILFAEDRFLSFINNSIPPPKLTPDFGAESFIFNEIGSKSLNPISMISIFSYVN